jgi:hypothetical protein
MSVLAICDALVHARTPRRKALFVQRSQASMSELALAEDRLRCSLPETFKVFVDRLGVGDLNEELRFLTPSELCAIGPDGVPWSGFIVFAEDDLGNSLAFGASDAECESKQAVFYICHDPFGYAMLSETFEAFLVDLAAQEFQYVRVVSDPKGFVEVELPRCEAANERPWWRFW